MAIEIAIATGVTPTSITTASYEVTGFGTPQAAIVFCNNTYSGNSPAADMWMSQGFTDGTRQNLLRWGITSGATATPLAGFRQDATNLIGLVNGSRTSQFTGTFSSWATDGITISFDVAPPQAYDVTVILIKGCNSAYTNYKQLTTTGVNDITDPGFKPNLVFAGTLGYEVMSGTSTQVNYSFGAAHNSSTDTVTQGATIFHTNDAINSQHAVRTNSAAFVRDWWDGWDGAATAFDASGFSVDTGANSPGNAYITYLALDTGDTDGVDISIVDSPTSTGTWTVTDPGFTPQAVLLGLNTATAVDSSNQADPIGFGLGMFTSTTERYIGMDGDDDAATTAVQTNVSNSNAVDLYHYSGGHTNFAQGSFSAFTGSGYSLSFPTTVNGTVRKWLSIAIASSGTSVAPLAVQHLNMLNNG